MVIFKNPNNLSSNASNSKGIQFAGVHSGMLRLRLSLLEVYVYAALYGITEKFGAGRGTTEKLVSYLQITDYSDAEIQSTFDNLIDMELVEIKDGPYPNTYVITANEPPYISTEQ